MIAVVIKIRAPQSFGVLDRLKLLAEEIPPLFGKKEHFLEINREAVCGALGQRVGFMPDDFIA